MIAQALLLVLLAPSVLGHGWMKLAGISGQQLSKAQKTDLGSSFVRPVSANTGWVGSDHLNSPAITCGMSQTPFNTNAAPSGTVFASAGQSAGKTLTIKAGQKFQVVISGNPGDGWPHPNGHVQTYLGYCGEGATACQGFDASKAKFFKIQQVINGIQDKLRPAYDKSVDGNRWDIPIPTNIKSGSYILRYELIAFGQSSAVEGHQDQYYPFCAQLNIQDGKASSNNFATVSFPGAYKNGNIDQKSAPGPKSLAVSTGGDDENQSTGTDTSDEGSSDDGEEQDSGSCSSKRARRKARRAAKRAAIAKRSAAAIAAHAAKRSQHRHN